MSDHAKKRRKKRPPIIGWREWCGLPDLGIDHIRAKVDSGARSSSLDATEIEFFDRDGEEWVRFRVHLRKRSDKRSQLVEAPLLETRRVRSSNGSVTRRPVIESRISMMDQTWPVELTLIDRSRMGFRMLLGRQAFRGRFLLDAGRSYRGGRHSRSD